MMVIDRFDGPFEFLSNFYSHKLRFEGATYRTAEHAFQAQKTVIRSQILGIKSAPTPASAKRLGRKCTLREDWDLIKVQVMERIVRAKFKDPYLRRKLLDTGHAELIEGNYWYDTFWGVYNGRGENWLGKTLMKVRDEIRQEQREARHPRN